MKLTTISSKVTGTPSASGWVQIHEFTPIEEEKIKSRGHLFLVIATKRLEEASGPEGLRPGGEVSEIIAGREIISRFQEEYYGDLAQKPFEALKKSVEKIIAEFKTNFGDIEVSACALVGEIIYSAASGGGQVVILRDGMLAAILASVDDGVITASGYPKKGKFLPLGPKEFSKGTQQEESKPGFEIKIPLGLPETLPQ